MKTLFQFFGLMLTLVLTSCLPYERFWWSPDGSQAVVKTSEGLHLVKPGQPLGAPFQAGMAEGFPTSASWLADGSGFVIVQGRRVKTWAEARTLLPETEVAEVERLSRGVPGLVESMVAMAGKAESASDVMSRSPLAQEKGMGVAALYCAYERDKASFEAALLKIDAGAEILSDIPKDLGYEVYEIKLVKPGVAVGERAIVRSLRPLLSARVSPKFDHVAYLRFLEKQEVSGVEVCAFSRESGAATVAPVEIAGGVGGSYGWTPDGQSLVVTRPFSGKDELVQRIQSLRLLDEKGALIPQEDRVIVDLALSVMPTQARLEVLPDGRILFAALPATLPVAGTGPDLEPILYTVQGNGENLRPVPAAPGALPVDLSWFVASPDGKRVAVVESGTDVVAVLELETGKTEVISLAHDLWRCRTLPSWKSNTELTFAALDKSGTHPQWMIWSVDGKTRVLSEGWADAAMGEWLEKQQADKKAEL
ncbi:MAG: hypothetical protein ACAI34_18680 [Verrucomicrobium sp.]